MKTLYEKLGGQEAVQLAVEKFYERVMQDERVKHFFAGVDMKTQKAHQRAFLTYAFGGADRYSGQDMRSSHKRLVEEMGLSDEHFDAIAEDLMETLKELGVSEELQQEVAAIAASTAHRNDILNR